MLFPSHVKRIIFCFVYSENHHPSCIYLSLEEEDLHTTYIVDVDSISIPQPVHKDDHCIQIPLESDQPCNHTEVRTYSNPVHSSTPCGITVEPCNQHVSSHTPGWGDMRETRDTWAATGMLLYGINQRVPLSY
jgi:hypothetical protein